MLPACMPYLRRTSRTAADCCPPADRVPLPAQRSLLGVLGREPHRIAHVKGRARAERAHVVGRDVGVGMHDADRGGIHVERLGRDLRHHRVGPLPHIDGADIKCRSFRRHTRLTMATEVVGAVMPLKPMAMPRPRRIRPSPRSNGVAQFIRSATWSSTGVERGVLHRPCRPPADVPRAAGSCGGIRPCRCRALRAIRSVCHS